MSALASYDPIAFAGAFHFLVLHAPIGGVAAVWLVETFALLRRTPTPGLRRLLLGWTALSALAAVATGWMLAATTDHGPIIGRHKIWAIATAVSFSVAFAFDVFGRGRRGAAIGRVLTLLIATLLLTATGHLGGSATHGRGHLSRHAPPWFARLEHAVDARLLPPPRDDGPTILSDTATTTDGAEAAPLTVAGILERHCVECHGPDKQKGDLRLDTEDGIRSVIDPPDVAFSELTRRVLLPRGHDEAMPDKGDGLSPDEVWTLIRWIQDGAAMDAIGSAPQNPGEGGR